VSKIIDGHHGSIRIEVADGSAGGGGLISGAGSAASGPGARFVIFFPDARENTAVGSSAHLVIS